MREYAPLSAPLMSDTWICSRQITSTPSVQLRPSISLERMLERIINIPRTEVIGINKVRRGSSHFWNVFTVNQKDVAMPDAECDR